MTDKKQKLELTWIGKDEVLKLEPRILIEDPEKSHGDTNSSNMLIHGDNLLALKALEQDFAGLIKCIYIDPPFNTGAAFEHYDDGIEHSLWLNLMYQRLLVLKKLLRDDGVIFVHLDNTEMAYCKVLLDEIFLRKNYLNTISMTTNDPSGFKATGSAIFSTVNYLLVYAKDRSFSELKKIYIEKDYDKAYSKVILNIEDPYKDWKFSTIVEILSKELSFSDVREMKKSLGSDQLLNRMKEFAIKNANKVFRTAAIGGGAKLKRQRTIDQSRTQRDIVFVHPNEDIENFYILNGEQLLFYKDRLHEINGKLTPGEVITDVWTDISWTGIAKEGNVEFKNGKKPEKLVQRCLELVNANKDDWVLDSFLGGGTTAAVAHKLGLKWIGIELGEQANTHCIPRLIDVVNGTDQTGISKSVKWKGGGGFKFYNLAPSLLRKDNFGNFVIDEQYNANMLAEAMCKHEGFKYSPNVAIYWKQGRSTETDYIFVTTGFVTKEQLDSIHEQMAENESLLICAKSFTPGCESHCSNITIKKIPQMILGKCEFSKDNYDLNILKATVEEAEESNEAQDEQ